MLGPAVTLDLGSIEFAFQILHHAQVVQRMDVAGDHLRQSAHACALTRRGRQDLPFAVINFIQVFDDRHRLADHAHAVDQYWNQFLGIEFAERRRMLLAARIDQMHGHDVVDQAFQIQRDAHAKRGT